MALIELALVLVYMAVLLMKSCFMSASVCMTYGFGDSPKGDARGLAGLPHVHKGSNLHVYRTIGAQ